MLDKVMVVIEEVERTRRGGSRRKECNILTRERALVTVKKLAKPKSLNSYKVKI